MAVIISVCLYHQRIGEGVHVDMCERILLCVSGSCWSEHCDSRVTGKHGMPVIFIPWRECCPDSIVWGRQVWSSEPVSKDTWKTSKLFCCVGFFFFPNSAKFWHCTEHHWIHIKYSPERSYITVTHSYNGNFTKTRSLYLTIHVHTVVKLYSYTCTTQKKLESKEMFSSFLYSLHLCEHHFGGYRTFFFIRVIN